MNEFMWGESLFIWNCVWMSSLCLLAGMAVALFWRNRPSRAHAVLFASIAACCIAPLLSQFVHVMNWGLLNESSAPIETIAHNGGASQPGETSTDSSDLQEEGAFTISSPSSSSQPATDSSIAATRATEPLAGNEIHFSWMHLFIMLWIGASLVLASRLCWSVFLGAQVVARRRALDDSSMQGIVERISAQLKLPDAPSLYASEDVECPVIWCWRRTPILLIPKTLLSVLPSSSWESLLCHELAHWKRKDHWTNLFSDIALILFPWQPLMWLSVRTLKQMSENACDDWAVASNQSATLYAESLLTIIPQKKPLFALPTARDSLHLQKRIQHILRGPQSNPSPGKFWSLAVYSSMLIFILCAALIQTPSSIALTNGSVESQSDAGEINAAKTAMMSVRQLNCGDVVFGSIPGLSLDGEKLYGWDINCNLVIVDTDTGEKKVLDQYYDWGGSVLSPDGTRIAYVKSNDEGTVDSLIVLTIETGEKEIFHTQDQFFEICDWSSDKSLILTQNARKDKNGEYSCFTIDCNTKAVKKIEAGNQSYRKQNLRFSPDGKTITYNSKETGRNVLHFYRLDNSHHEIFDDIIGEMDSPLWSFDGKYLAFKVTQNEQTDLWALGMENNLPRGYPILVQPNVEEIKYLNWTLDGKLAYHDSYFKAIRGLYILPINLNTGVPIGRPRKIMRGGLPWLSWGPDGKSILVYSSWMTLTVLDPNQGEILKTIEVKNMSRINQYCLDWSAKRNKIITGGINKVNQKGLYAIDMDTGIEEFLLEADDGWTYVCLGADDNTVIYRSSNGVFLFDWEQQKAQNLFPPMKKGDEIKDSFRLSPKGNTVAYKQGNKLMLTELASKETHEIKYSEDKSKFINFFDWSPDARFIVLNTICDEGVELWIIPMEDREPFLLPIPSQLGYPINPRWSPDGNSIAFHMNSNEDNRYWIMENFLPEVQ